MVYLCIDVLINNVGVMWMLKQVIKDGFELQFGINYFGYFVLIGLVFDYMLLVFGLWVVIVSSQGYWIYVVIYFDDLQWECCYNCVVVYG